MQFEIYSTPGANATNKLLAGLLNIEWRWRLRAANNEIIASGEGYTSKQSCAHAIGLIRSTNASTPIVETQE